MTLRSLMTEYILFAFTSEDLLRKFYITESELQDMSDIDLLELYDSTILTPINK
jgi:hypothetical protein